MQEPKTDSVAGIQNYFRPTIMDGFFAAPKGAFSEFTVLLEIYSEKGELRGRCTGVIVASDIVLSAGHCAPPSAGKVKIKVSFGIGGSAGYTHTEFAENYVSIFPTPRNDSEATDGPYLEFDRQNQYRFEVEVTRRPRFLNFYGKMLSSEFKDLMVVKIPKIPNGYRPIDFFSGTLNFREPVKLAGFGLSTRIRAQHEVRLRFSEGQLVGHYTEPNSVTMGYQVYVPTRQQFCYGDSGGPLVAKDHAGNYLLVGIGLSTVNECANSSYFLNPSYYGKTLVKLIDELRRSKKL